MTDQQMIHILNAIQALENKLVTFKGDVNRRFDNLEHRVTNLEGTAAHSAQALGLSTPSATQLPSRPPAVGMLPSRRLPASRPLPSVQEQSTASYGSIQQSLQTSRPPLSATRGSSHNTQWLPYAIEMVAWAAQRKNLNDNRRCHCGAPTFEMTCFQSDHFRWCRAHQRPIIRPHTKCGKDYVGCVAVKWEHHNDWELLVKTSFDCGFLGTKSVQNLSEFLFPADLYPEKYEAGWLVG